MRTRPFHVNDALKGRKANKWYQTEKNTAALIRASVASRGLEGLTGDDIWNLIRLTWNLIRLTWITVHGEKVVPDNWKSLKVPALAHLFKRESVVGSDLAAAIDALGLPSPVSEAAKKTTGIVNFRNTWRNSSKDWCVEHRKSLIDILRDARNLRQNDEARYTLAARIDGIPGVASPNGAIRVGAAATLTPVVACLDPSMRFPIVNGRDMVKALLRALRLSNGDLERQVKGLVNLIGQFGIEDAFMLDALAERIAESASGLIPEEERTVRDEEGSDLPYLDEDERSSTLQSKTILYRNRHNRMTDRLKSLFRGHSLKQGTRAHCRYDVLVKDYDNCGRDLLIEAKPDPGPGAIRIAIGQLLDYRRHLSNRLATDIALLTISEPNESYTELLFDLQVSVLWFADEKCRKLTGSGKAWSAVKKIIAQEV